MNKTSLRLLVLFVVLLLAQAIVFDNLVLFNCAMPFVFIYMLIALPVTISTNMSLTIGFLMGLGVDSFADTYGMNAMACTLLAFMRKPILHLYVQSDEDFSGNILNSKVIGQISFLKFSLTMTLVYCILVFLIESFSLFNPLKLIERIGASTFYTFIVIYAIDSLSISRREKKL